MPRQNRVTPFGEIIAVPERGTMMGNRGSPPRRPRPHPPPLAGEAVAHLPAGVPRAAPAGHDPGPLHRTLLPRRGDRPGRRPSPLLRVPPGPFLAFRDAWAVGNGIDVADGRPTADSIDDRLHAERVGPGRSKRTFTANIDDLPDGVFVTLGTGRRARLPDLGGHLLAWSPGGYRGDGHGRRARR